MDIKQKGLFDAAATGKCGQVVGFLLKVNAERMALRM